MDNRILEERINEVIATMNGWAKQICLSIKNADKEKEITASVLQNKIILNSIPEDFFLFVNNQRHLSIQMIKPVINVVLCYYEQGKNSYVFTDSIEEAIGFLLSDSEQSLEIVKL